MTYVDASRVWHPQNLRTKMAGRQHGQSWCHMWADSEEELHAMADRIGLKRAWCQRKEVKLMHYDLTPPRRAAAVVAGALETSIREWRRAKAAPHT